ncbi:MAG: hypothetical protein WD993_03575 [Thermoleophilaceae bacterium]
MSDQRRLHVETDPIGAIRTELVAAARRRRATRLRRRRLATVAATLVATLACVAAASALTDLGTGIPAIDRFLGNYSRNTDRNIDGPPSLHPSAQLDAVPKLGGPAVAIEVPWGPESERAVASLYTSQGGRLCFALVEPVEPGVGMVRGRQESCHDPQILGSRVREKHAVLSGVTFGESTVVHGYAAPGVDVTGVTGPKGPLRVRASEAIPLESPDLAGLRLFVAYRTDPLMQRDRWSAATPRGGDPRRYAVHARLDDGRAIENALLPLGGD